MIESVLSRAKPFLVLVLFKPTTENTASELEWGSHGALYGSPLPLSSRHHNVQQTQQKLNINTLKCVSLSLTHTHTVLSLFLSLSHTHTHVGFYGLRGLSIGVMVFILYKLYVLLPYTYPTPKLSPHRRRCISTFPQKNSLCMIYKRFKLWGHWKCPHKSPSSCNTCVIPMSLYKFVSS